MSVEQYVKETLPFLHELPIWIWFVSIWLITNLLLKPYMQAVVRLYQPKMDAAARATPSIIKKIFIEIYRLLLIATQFPHSLLFIVIPHSKRLKIWRKNYIVFYVWLYSKEFPSPKYKRQVTEWYEKNVYLNKKTSYLFPEPLLEDWRNTKEKLEKIKKYSYDKFKKNKLHNPKIRVYSAIRNLNPREWLGRKFVFWIIFYHIYSTSLILFFFFIFKGDSIAIYFLFFGLISIIIDKYFLSKMIIKYAMLDKIFYENAILTETLIFDNKN